MIQILLFLCGGLMTALSFLLYEDEERRVQNRLEDIWLSIRDGRCSYTSNHSAFVELVARKCSTLVNRLLGSRIFSLQAFSVSGVLSYASWALFFFFCVFTVRLTYWAIGSFLAFIILVYIGVLPVTKPRLKNVPIIFFLIFLLVLPLMDLVMFGFLAMLDHRRLIENIQVFGWRRITFLVGIYSSIVLDIAMVAVTRKVLAKASPFTSSTKTLFVFGCCLVLGFLMVFLGPYIGGAVLIYNHSGLWSQLFALGVIYSAGFNLVSILVPVLFFALSGSLLLHRAVWPFLDRPFYALQRFGVFRHRKILRSVGIVLMCFALGIPHKEWIP